MRRYLVLIGILLGILTLGVIKVGFIYVGPIGDHGWTYAHDLGRRYVEKVFGNEVETTYMENVPDGMESLNSIVQVSVCTCMSMQ